MNVNVHVQVHVHVISRQEGDWIGDVYVYAQVHVHVMSRRVKEVVQSDKEPLNLRFPIKVSR